MHETISGMCRCDYTQRMNSGDLENRTDETHSLQEVCRWHDSIRDGMLFSMTDVTKILSQIEQGDTNAAEQLLPLVYNELRKLAAAKP